MSAYNYFMRKTIIDGWYQLPEFPSVPYTPANFWDSLGMINGVKIIDGEEPVRPTCMNFYRNPSYDAIFYFKRHCVKVRYNYDELEHKATVILDGLKENLRDVEKIIRREHRRLGERLWGISVP